MLMHLLIHLLLPWCRVRRWQVAIARLGFLIGGSTRASRCADALPNAHPSAATAVAASAATAAVPPVGIVATDPWWLRATHQVATVQALVVVVLVIALALVRCATVARPGGTVRGCAPGTQHSATPSDRRAAATDRP
jgi:hypothetical protein